MSRAAKLLCIGAWLLILAISLYYYSGLPNSFNMNGIDVSREIALRQKVLFLRITIGVFLAVSSFPLKRWWPLPVIASSLTYLIPWYWSGPLHTVGLVDGYELLSQTAARFHLLLDFVCRDLVVPGALIVALVTAICHVHLGVLRRKAKAA